MTRKQIFWISFLIGFLLTGSLTTLAFLGLHKLVPQQVNWQALRLSDLEGQPVSLQELEGKVVLVNVWATWCKPCIKEMPALDRLQQQASDRIAIVTISDEDTLELRKFAERNSYSFRYWKANAPLAKQKLTSFPTTYVLNHVGEIKQIYLGEQEWDSPAMQQKLLSYSK